MIIRKTYTMRNGDVVDVEEYPDGRYGAPGFPRRKRRKATEEDMERVNQMNKMKKCRRYLLEYFHPGDSFITWTYEPRQRPPDMREALKDFQKAIKFVKREYAKRNRELFWIRNIERGTKGAWHIHLVVIEIDGTAEIIKKAWKKGGTYQIAIKDSEKLSDVDFTALASYLTKDEHTKEKKENGEWSKPRLKEASYSHSRNMQLVPAEKDRLARWKKEPKPKKGYYIACSIEGINPKTGLRYRRYTMIRLNRRI